LDLEKAKSILTEKGGLKKNRPADIRYRTGRDGRWGRREKNGNI